MAFLCDDLGGMTLTGEGVSLQLQTVVISYYDWVIFKNLDRHQSPA